jgi:hypothetical protein
MIYTYINVFLWLYLQLWCNYNMHQCKFHMWQPNNCPLNDTWQHLGFKMYFNELFFYFFLTIHYLSCGNPTIIAKETLPLWQNGVTKLQLALQLGFWIVMTFCNSKYFYRCKYYWTSHMNCNGCNSPYVKSHTYASCATQLQLFRNNYCATLMQLVCNYHGNVMLMLLFINPSKKIHVALWGFLGKKYFLFEILIFTIHHDYSFYMVLLWHVAQSKISMWHIN